MDRAGLAQPSEPTWDWDELRHACGRDLRRLLGDFHAAEDATQEALVRAWRNRHKCLHSDAPAPWVRRIAHNEGLRLVSRNSERREADGVEDEHPAAGCLEEQVLSRLSVEQILGRLSGDDRELVRLRYEQDLPHGAIADRLGIPEATVRVRVHRVRKRLSGLIMD
jgi:RNA polymerase sigma-70 factor, ECF subfamily